ncbi:MAG: hypothetical protein PVI33_03595 [Candidatus Omnitrophota bacterium]
MRKFFIGLLVLSCFLVINSSNCLAKEQAKFLLLIAEQNIEGPQRCWWASEIDLSTVEAELSKQLIAGGYQVLDPSQISGVLSKEEAFRSINLSDEKSIELAKLSQADYVILGKAVASSGGNVPESNMLSCFANVTIKLIRVDDGQIIAYLDAGGSSAHLDVISGGREALLEAADDLAIKVINALNQEGKQQEALEQGEGE